MMMLTYITRRPFITRMATSYTVVRLPKVKLTPNITFLETKYATI